ncbi:MAG: phosphoketolase, partial [Clostridia bacterium]|nr:phosphoketolase [Clostridia bacterium]
DFASNNPENPDVILACAGDVITMEAVAGAMLLKKHVPSLNFRFINIVDLMKLASPAKHPHGLRDSDFDKLFTTDKPIIFNYHGYASLIHELTWARKNRQWHVNGYDEEGRISTPFDMRVQNKVDRYNFVKTVLKTIPQTEEVKAALKEMDKMLAKHKRHITKYGTDIPEVGEWK